MTILSEVSLSSEGMASMILRVSGLGLRDLWPVGRILGGSSNLPLKEADLGASGSSNRTLLLFGASGSSNRKPVFLSICC